MPPIYLDYNATTPIDPVVFAAMEPYLRDYFGNPSSDHAYGERTREAISRAREQVAALIGAESETIVFTGSGSEANNLALKGVALTYRAHGNHIITSAIEHPAITALSCPPRSSQVEMRESWSLFCASFHACLNAKGVW